MTATQQKIIPHLWFDTQAQDAAQFYCSVFPCSSIKHSTILHNTPGGDCEQVSFMLSGYQFMAISAGPIFKLNPSVSFMINFDPAEDKNARVNIDLIWEKLSDGGKVLMPLDTYPFSERYGWVEDKFGVSWQLILSDPGGEDRPFIMPVLLFVGDVCGQAEAASEFYLSVFDDSERGELVRYPSGMEPDKEGHVMFTDFKLEGQWFVAMDSAREHGFQFNEAISLMVNCHSQGEIDHYWQKLSAMPQAEQCGWLKDQYGLSWQINPEAMQQMLQDPDQKKVERVTQSFLQMKKLDIATLEQAYKG